MNTEKLEKLKKSLDNKFIPDSMKDKIRTEIQKLESEIKQKEITPTEIKEEVKNIEEKVEEALEVAEKKEEKQEESKPKTTKKATTGTKKTAMALAKKIRKEGESWTDAVKRAGNQMKGIKDDVKKETKSEIEKLKSLIRKRKDLKGVSNSNIMRDGHRKALPMGKRTSATGHTYYENRRNHADIGKVGELYLAKGGNIDYKHNYMMLSRLQMDCEYYLNYGNRNEKVLWAGNVDEQIEEMKRLWNSFPKDAKPEWLTMNQILDYEKQMKNSYANGGSIPNNYEGKTPKQVWNMWTPQQREHFLADHYDVMDKDDLGAKNKEFSELNFLTQAQLTTHIIQGQYANGGGVWTNEQRLAVEKLDADFEKEVEKEDIESNSKDASDLWRSGGFQKRMRKIFNKEDDDVYANGGGVDEWTHNLKYLTSKKVYFDITTGKVYPKINLKPNMSKGKSIDEFDDKWFETLNDNDLATVQNYINNRKEFFGNGTDFMNTPVYHRGGALPFENGGGFDDRDKQGMIYALQEHISSGEIANMTDLLTYDSIAESRSKAIEYYVKYGDKPYSMTELKKVLSIVSTPLYHKYKSKFEDGGDFMSGVYAEKGMEVSFIDYNDKEIMYEPHYKKYYANDVEFDTLEEAKNFIDSEEVPEYIRYGYSKGVFENGGDFMSGVYAEDGAMVNKDGVRVKSVAMPEKELTEAEWLAKHNESREARAYAVGGGIFADTFTVQTGTHYTGLVGETNAMSSGEMFMAGGRVRRTKAQITRDRENKEIDAYNWYVVDLETNRAITGNEYKEDAIDVLSDYDDKKRYKVVSKKTLKSLGIENPNESWKSYENGGGVGDKKYHEIIQKEDNYIYLKMYDKLNNRKDYENKLQELLMDITNYGDVDVVVYETTKEIDTEEKFEKYFKNLQKELNEYADGGAIANQQLIADAHLRPAEMFGREGIPAYKRGGRIKYNNGGEYSQYGKFIASQIEYLISLKTIASKKEPIQNLLKNMDNYRGTEIEKRITTDNLKYALQQKTVSKMNEVLRISLNALKD